MMFPTQNQSTYGKSDWMTHSTSFIEVAVMGLFAIVAVACSPKAGRGQTATESSATTPAIASLSVSLSPAKERSFAPALNARLGEKAAPLASGLAYIKGAEAHLVADEEAYLVIDEDQETIWSSKQPAPQWYSAVLDQSYPVDRVEMIITLAPPGPTTREALLGH